MKIEEYKDVIYKTVKFCGHEYVLEDKNILLNSIYISAHFDYMKCNDSQLKFGKNGNFTIGRVSDNKYRIFISNLIDCNEFIINYGVLRDIKKLTLDKDECPDIIKKEDGSTEIVFQKNVGE